MWVNEKQKTKVTNMTEGEAERGASTQEIYKNEDPT